MGFYIRKSFSAGPMRLNLSKSGLGVSTGIKGLRLGTGPRGAYIHAGRGGLYYRKHLGSNIKHGSNIGYGTSSQQSTASLKNILIIIGGIFLFALVINVLVFLMENPVVFIFVSIALALVLGFIIYRKLIKRKAIKAYKNLLDEIFLLGTTAFEEKEWEIDEIKKKLIKSGCKADIETIGQSTYNAVLSKIIDDNKITLSEKKVIQDLESIINVDDSYKNRAKVEIFKSYYLNAIQDRLITDTEINTLNNIAEGLEIDQSLVKEEMKIVKEIIRMQNLKYPLTPITDVPVTINKSETAFYSSLGKIISKKKAPKNSGSEYEYCIKREGTLVVTNKRVLVVKEGTTSIDINDILDVDVDLDNKYILISKGSTVTPTIIQTEEALFCGKMIDILRNNIGK